MESTISKEIKVLIKNEEMKALKERTQKLFAVKLNTNQQ